MAVAVVAVLRVVAVGVVLLQGVVSQEEVPEADLELQGEALPGVEGAEVVSEEAVEVSEEAIVAVVAVALVDEAEDEVEASEVNKLCGKIEPVRTSISAHFHSPIKMIQHCHRSIVDTQMTLQFRSGLLGINLGYKIYKRVAQQKRTVDRKNN